MQTSRNKTKLIKIVSFNKKLKGIKIEYKTITEIKSNYLIMKTNKLPAFF